MVKLESMENHEEVEQPKRDKKRLICKIFCGLLLVVAVFEAATIYYLNIDYVKLPTYSFVDLGELGGLVTAEGSWVSSEKPESPFQTVDIQCWQNWGNCIIAVATYNHDNNFLSNYVDIGEIAEWTDEYIQTKPAKPMEGSCVEEYYRLDRRSELVTYTRNIISQDDICKGKEPIVYTLKEGYERFRVYQSSNKSR